MQSEFPAKRILSTDDATNFIRQFYSDDIEVFESSFILLLNQSNTTIGYAKISQGGITGTVIDIRIVLKYAIESLATGIIICHNHPSGNIDPSEQDRLLTRKLNEAVKLFDIRLLDHIILTKDNSYSFTENNQL